LLVQHADSTWRFTDAVKEGTNCYIILQCVMNAVSKYLKA